MFAPCPNEEGAGIALHSFSGQKKPFERCDDLTILVILQASKMLPCLMPHCNMIGSQTGIGDDREVEYHRCVPGRKSGNESHQRQCMHGTTSKLGTKTPSPPQGE